MPQRTKYDETEASIIGNIKSLQSQEQKLFLQLQKGIETNPNDPTLNTLIDQINQLSELRYQLYASLNQMGSYYSEDARGTATSLKDQTIALQIVEQQLNQSKARLDYVENQKLSKLRLVEINQYYGKKYNDHAHIMRTLVIIFAVIFVLTIFYNSYLLPERLYYICIYIIVIVGGIFLLVMLSKSMKHSNMNYDEYKWYFNVDKAPKLNASYSGDANPWATSNTCVGKACCMDSETYDPEIAKCIPSCGISSSGSSSSSLTGSPFFERYKNMYDETDLLYSAFTQGARASRQKPDVILGTRKVQANDPENKYFNETKYTTD
jgi:hypothetical protein